MRWALPHFIDEETEAKRGKVAQGHIVRSGEVGSEPRLSVSRGGTINQIWHSSMEGSYYDVRNCFFLSSIPGLLSSRMTSVSGKLSRYDG